MDARTITKLQNAAGMVGTPCYVYDMDIIRERFAVLDRLFGRNFGVSFAVKSNPNTELLRCLLPLVVTLDVSSYAEVERGVNAGCPPERLTFSGPAKRRLEVEGAVKTRVGELVLESVAEAEMASKAAQALGVEQHVLVRINPSWMPRHFGVNMAGKASQFGVDEEVLEESLDRISALPNLKLIGFHIYSGTNSLNHEAIAENFGNFIKIFRKAAAHTGISPEKLIFGSGFGIPYNDGDKSLDIEALAALVMPMIDEFKADPTFSNSACVLEMGRWLIGPGGWLLTGVISEKSSRGTEIRACDAGFNNHLAACGMMGTVIRRNWSFANVTNPDGPVGKFLLVGPLCTTIDVLASDISLPEVRIGDVLSVANSGAYGLTASPTRFISHPEPAEVIVDGNRMVDATESALNHWTTVGEPKTAASQKALSA